MVFLRNKPVRILVLLMSVLAGLAILVSRSYYRGRNLSVDPRVVNARVLYNNYNRFASANAFDSVFILMDSIESIYTSVPHYRESFEIGVLYNNRAAAYLTLLMAGDSASFEVQDSLLTLADAAVQNSIEIYENWIDRFDSLPPSGIRELISDNFLRGLDPADRDKNEVYLEKRIEEIEEAQIETPRRLSVSYTNLGIVERKRLRYEEAANAYMKALELWDRNLTAENNLNMLLGKPQKKQNFIQRMFPPERTKQ